MAKYPGGSELIDLVITDLRAHTGPDAEQEDDITMVTLSRSPVTGSAFNGAGPSQQLVEFTVPSAEGNERIALERVSAIVAPLGLSEARLKRLETAVGEEQPEAVPMAVDITQLLAEA